MGSLPHRTLQAASLQKAQMFAWTQRGPTTKRAVSQRWAAHGGGLRSQDEDRLFPPGSEFIDIHKLVWLENNTKCSYDICRNRSG